MKKTYAIIFLMLASLSVIANGQPAEVVEDGFSEAASAWLKKHPNVQKCAGGMADSNNKERKKKGLEERTTYAEYGEFIGVCAKKSPAKVDSFKKMKGDQIDNNPNAKPNNQTEAKNKRDKKAWQDNNGFMHFPDGSISSGPID